MEADADSVRTCVGCGSTDAPDSMERFVWAPETGLLHDLRRKAPGRGVHVHPDRQCLTLAAKSGFRRGFKAPVEVGEPDALIATFRVAIHTRLTESLRLAVQSQVAGVGSKAVDQKLKSNAASVMFVATDAGEATRKKYVANAERKQLPVVSSFDGATMGGWSGREFVAVMTVGGRLGESVFRDVECLARLGRDEG